MGKDASYRSTRNPVILVLSSRGVGELGIALSGGRFHRPATDIASQLSDPSKFSTELVEVVGFDGENPKHLEKNFTAAN